MKLNAIEQRSLINALVVGGVRLADLLTEEVGARPVVRVLPRSERVLDAPGLSKTMTFTSLSVMGTLVTELQRQGVSSEGFKALTSWRALVVPA